MLSQASFLKDLAEMTPTDLLTDRVPLEESVCSEIMPRLYGLRAFVLRLPVFSKVFVRTRLFCLVWVLLVLEGDL